MSLAQRSFLLPCFFLAPDISSSGPLKIVVVVVVVEKSLLLLLLLLEFLLAFALSRCC